MKLASRIALLSLFLLTGVAAPSAAGTSVDGDRLVEVVTGNKFFDRPDLLNFDPFHATGSLDESTETFTFETMGQTYTTSLASYTEYGFDCFSDPDPDRMLDENFVCVRAGHRRPNRLVYALEYADYGGYGAAVYTAFAEGLFGSEVYVSGYFHVMTDEGGEVFGEYLAEIPDKLVRRDDKIKYTQKAFVDFGARIEEEGETLSSFLSWFEGCELKANVKGVAADADGPMSPPNKQGELTEISSKLDCDSEAVNDMFVKVADGADPPDQIRAGLIYRAALAKLGREDRIKLRVQDDDGTEILDLDDDDDDDDLVER